MLRKIFILSSILLLLLQGPLFAAERNYITADSNSGNILNRIFGGNNRRYYNNKNRNYNYDNYDNNYNRNDNRQYNNNNNNRYKNRRRNNNR